MTYEQAVATAQLQAWQKRKGQMATFVERAPVVRIDEDARVYALRRLRVRAGGRP